MTAAPPMVEAPAATSRTQRNALLDLAAAVAIALLVVAIYAPALDAAFVFDDIPGIVERVDQLEKPFPAVVAGERRPVVTLTLAANHALGGLDPRGYRAFNVAVHLAAALVLLDLVRRLAGRFVPTARARTLAFAAAALWAVHPLQTEAVTYVIQRSESMAALCMLLVLQGLARSVDSRHPGWWHGLAIAACAVGMACKATMVAAPFLAFAFDALLLARTPRAALRDRWGVHAALASCWLVLLPTGVIAAATGRTAGPAAVGLGVPGIPPLAYLQTQPGVVLHYLGLAFWPQDLCLDRGWPIATSARAIVLPSIVVLAGVAAIVLAVARRAPLAACGILFIAWLAPTSSIMPLRDAAVEHRMYLPLAALTTAVVVGAVALLRRANAPRALGAALLAIACLALGARTVARNRDYATPVAMWESARRVAPEHRRVLVNLGAAYRDAGRLDDAIALLEPVAASAPRDPAPHLALALALLDAGRAEDAVPHLYVAANGRTRDADVALLLGAVLRDVGRCDESARMYARAALVEPSAANAIALGDALMDAGDEDRAADAFMEAIGRAAGEGRADLEASAWFNLGNLRFRSESYGGAAEAYRRALEAQPSHDGARRWLEEARARSGGT